MTTVALPPPERLAARGAWSPRTAFVLSGGASLGALQVGMLEALYEQDITPDFLVGTSVGALNAAFVASRPQSPRTARELIYVLPTLAPDSRPARVPTGALDTAIHGLYLLMGSRLGADIARYSTHAELILLPAPNAGCVQPTSFEHSRRLIADARAATRTALQRPPSRAHLRLVS
jgi:hypothetical protein